MLDRSWPRRIALATAAGGVALALAAAPIAPDGELPGFALKAALAKAGGDKGGNGADKGNKGGHKGGKKGGAGGAGATILVNTEDSHGKGHTGKGNGHRKDKDAVSGVESFHEGEDHENVKSLLGRLNAAHANPNAMANAAGHSAVGLTAQYYDKLAEAEAAATEDEKVTLLKEAASLLTDLANKELTDAGEIGAVVEAYNGLLGIEATAEPDPVTAGPGFNDYGGFEISEEDESELIDAAVVEYEADDIGGGLGPPPPAAP